MKENIKNILYLLLFIAAVMLIAWALPLWADLGIVIIIQLFMLVIMFHSGTSSGKAGKGGL